ncbi:MAG: hypothetical protein WBP12_01245 [Candidatus Saccharimonas sp.]
MQFDTAHRAHEEVKAAYSWFVLADRNWSPDTKGGVLATEAERQWYYAARKDLVDTIFAKMSPPTTTPVIIGTSRRNRRQLRKQKAAIESLVEPIYPIDFMERAVAALDVEGLRWVDARFFVQPATASRPGVKYDPEALNMFVNMTGQGYLHVFYNSPGYTPMGPGHSHAVLAIGRGPDDKWSLDARSRHHIRN